MSEKAKEPQAPIQQMVNQPPVEVQKILNKVSVKYNAKSMLDQEVGEAMTEYINTTVQLINGLKAKIAELEAKVLPKEEKSKP